MVCGYTLPFVIAKIPMCDSSFDVSNPQMWCSYPLIWRFFVGKSWPVQVNWKAFKQISSFLWGRTPQSFPHFHRHPPPFLICRSSGMPILAKIGCNHLMLLSYFEMFAACVSEALLRGHGQTGSCAGRHWNHHARYWTLVGLAAIIWWVWRKLTNCIAGSLIPAFSHGNRWIQVGHCWAVTGCNFVANEPSSITFDFRHVSSVLQRRRGIPYFPRGCWEGASDSIGYWQLSFDVEILDVPFPLVGWLVDG